MKIAAIDFETANNSMASACALGVVIYDNGEITGEYYWLIKPHPRYFYFTNSSIHHLYKEDVINELEFVYYYDELKDILEDCVIVAHNAMFDISVLNAVCDLYGLDHFHNYYLDTVTLSRREYPELSNHKLNTVCAYLGIDLNHHEALSDAKGCLMILITIMARNGYYEINDYFKTIKAPKHIL